jgi:hypothetical protein
MRLTEVSRFALGRLLGVILLALAPAGAVLGQEFDTSWLDRSRAQVKIGVVRDGVYRVTGAQLSAAGVPISQISPSSLRMLENGKEIPLVVSAGSSSLGATDAIVFAGRRQGGTDEGWAFAGLVQNQSSTFYSLYSDTTYYWLSWGGTAGMRYAGGGAVTSPTNLAAVPQETHVEVDNLYFNGDGDAEISNPLYTRGEGYYMHRISHSTTATLYQTYDVDVPGIDRAATTDLNLRVKINSETASGHRAVLEAELAGTGGGVSWVALDSVSWVGYGFAELKASVAPSAIPTTADRVRLRVASRNTTAVNPTAAPNRLLIDYVKVSAVRALQAADGQSHFEAPAVGGFRYSLSALATTADVQVLSPARSIAWTVVPSSAFFDDNAPRGTAYFLARTTDMLSPARIVHYPAGSMPALDATSQVVDYIVLTTPFLRPSAEAFAAYRRSAAGGSYSVLVVNTQAIFDLFDYGRRRPIAISRFIRSSRAWGRTPQFLMMWGDTEWSSRTNPHKRWEVQSFGRSSSDGWFSMQWDGPNDWSEELHTGRIPIQGNEEGERFLTKLKNYESSPSGDWNKRALILAGGSGEAQQSTLQFYSSGWGRTIENFPFGGDVTYFYKTADTVLDPTFRDSIEYSIKLGAAWLGYFGHSSATRWEIVVDPPEEFGNAHALPVALSLGCYNGAFGSSTRVFAEDVVLKSMNGSIAHWGGTSSSFIGPAANIATPFYNIVYFEGERILGRALTEAKRRYVAIGGSLTIATNLQYNLIGDPATTLRLPSQPDLLLEPSSVSFEPFAPNLADGSLTVTVRVKNRGLVTRDSVTVEVIHWKPDDTRTTLTKKVGRVYLTDQIRFEIPIDESMVGDNRFRVTLDPENAYAEFDEGNNTVERTQIIFASGLNIVYPVDLGLVSTRRPTLRASLSSQEQDGTPVLFQLDVVNTFDSPALRTGSVTSSLAVEWTPPMDLDEGRTYYWRARVDDPTQPDLDWKAASFVVRSDLSDEGWHQQGEQFERNTQGNFITYSDNRWAFREFLTEFRLIHGREVAVGPVTYFWINPGWGAVLVDGNSGEIRQITLADEPTEEKISELEQLIEKARPGDIILARNRTFFDGWGWTDSAPGTIRVKAAFASVGATMIQSMNFAQFWVMAVKVGSEVQEWVVPRAEESTTRILEYGFSFSRSDSRSPLIGPARTWSRLVWNAELSSTGGKIAVDVLTPEGVVLRTDTLRYPESSRMLDLSALDASVHPVLRLRAVFIDELKASTPQLISWYVQYAGIPELIMDPSAFTLSADTVAEGQQITASTTVFNLSPVDAVNVDVIFEVTDASNRTRVVATDTLSLVRAHEMRSSSATISTVGLPGINRLTATARQRDLNEAVFYNNIAVSTFVVQADRVPPTFRVTIDGEEYPDDPRSVTSTDDPTLPFVSARPTIEVVVQDDSAFLPLADTALVHLSLNGKRLLYDRPDVRFEPGTLQKNAARITFTPDLSGRDTTHTISLWARDASGNANPRELEPYQVHFRIQNEADVETVYPYPNPMNSFTYFAFQLRGADPSLVDDFRIRVFTLNGQLVREFDLIRDPESLDGGMLRIGWNKVGWDVKDADGHDLGSGVYLYKVYLKAEGKEIAVNNRSGIEKLVVIR